MIIELIKKEIEDSFPEIDKNHTNVFIINCSKTILNTLLSEFTAMVYKCDNFIVAMPPIIDDKDIVTIWTKRGYFKFSPTRKQGYKIEKYD